MGTAASRKVLDTSNLVVPSLSSHREVIKAKWAEDAARKNHEITPVPTLTFQLEDQASTPPRSPSALVTDLGNQPESGDCEQQPCYYSVPIP
jgi:hypothetical protein